MIRIAEANAAYEREALLRPFGFKGGQLTELWQVAVKLSSPAGRSSIGLGTQSVLWSDARVFADHSETDGNQLMYALTQKAVSSARETSYASPMDMCESIVEEVHEYGQEITQNRDLRKTFALNALVALDNAAWLLYARENDIQRFDDMIPAPYRPALSHRHTRVAGIPLIAYHTPEMDMKAMVEEGHGILKIKLGQPGPQKEMLEKDQARMAVIHHTIGHLATSHTGRDKLLYYLDANSRYEKKETLLAFLDHAEKIGARDQILMIEEPFPETSERDVTGIDVVLAADESAHTDEDALRRIEMGYRAIALKPVAKTLSMTLKIAKVAHDRGVSCFCADLTVNPILLEWNKAVAARLSPMPGLDMGLLEANGHQNYKNWTRMIGDHPCAGAGWITPVNGDFQLDCEYYAGSGGIFAPSKHFESLFTNQKTWGGKDASDNRQ